MYVSYIIASHQWGLYNGIVSILGKMNGIELKRRTKGARNRFLMANQYEDTYFFEKKKNENINIAQIWRLSHHANHTFWNFNNIPENINCDSFFFFLLTSMCQLNAYSRTTCLTLFPRIIMGCLITLLLAPVVVTCTTWDSLSFALGPKEACGSWKEFTLSS